MANIKKIEKILDILRDYNGKNPYILMLKKDVFVKNKSNVISDFQIEYIEKNIDFEPKLINKITKISDWYGEKKKIDWGIDFVPQKLKIISLLGETDTIYHCYVQYRQSVPPVMCFIPKRAVINNFLHEDYNLIDVDFTRYDRLSTAKDPKRKIQEHQKDAVKFLLSRKMCILADDQGLGKTLSLSVAAIEGNFDSVLIICPASLKTNWKKELMWYVPERDITIADSFNNKTKGELEVFLGYSEGKSGKKRDELLEEAKKAGKWKDNRFVIVNYDILDELYTISHVRTEEGMKKLLDNNPMLSYAYGKKSLIIADEAHKLSNNKSNRYKVIRDMINKAKPDSVYLATGTPITNNPQNLFYILNLIENEVTSDYNYYAERYCNAQKFPAKGEREKWTDIFLKQHKKNSWHDLTGPEIGELKTFIRDHARMITVAKGADNLDELKEKISHIYLRRTKDDLELPPKTIHELYYNLSSVQKEEYDRLWTEYEQQQRETDPDKEINKELLEGGIYRRYLSTQMVKNTERLCDRLIQYGDKVVIMCCFDDELNTLKEYYGDKCVVHNGKMDAKQKDKAVEAFMTDPSVLVFIGNIISAGVGITLTKSHNLIFNDFSFVPGDNLQAMDRIHRIGQTKPVDIYVQIYRDTQYQNMWDIVLRKSLVINTLIKNEKEK